MINRELLENRKLRILLIESHAFQLYDTQSLLYDLGCHYLTPVMTREDLACVLATAPSCFDLAICSVGAFDMSNLELAERVYATHKVEHLILLSDGEIPPPALLARQVQRSPRPLLGILQKPLKRRPMMDMFARLLGQAVLRQA